MDGRRAIEQERQALQRFVAMLFALCRFCERISRMPLPFRQFFLWIMRPAEARVRPLILEMVEDFGFWTEVAPTFLVDDEDSSTAAIRLALRFRALAELLEDVLNFSDFPAADAQAPDFDGYEYSFSIKPLNRRSRKFRDLFEVLLGLPCWSARIPDT